MNPALLANFVTNENVSAVLFYLLAGVAGLSAIGVVASRNIVRTALSLLFTLLGVAGLYFLLEAEFLAAVQLVVYAGGTLILIVFGVMLTSKSPFSKFEPKRIEVVLGVSLAAILLATLIVAISQAHFAVGRADVKAGQYPMIGLGQVLLSTYLVPFEIASVLLLVVMIGAAYLAKGRRREGEKVARGSGLSEKARQWS